MLSSMFTTLCRRRRTPSRTSAIRKVRTVPPAWVAETGTFSVQLRVISSRGRTRSRTGARPSCFIRWLAPPSFSCNRARRLLRSITSSNRRTEIPSWSTARATRRISMRKRHRRLTRSVRAGRQTLRRRVLSCRRSIDGPARSYSCGSRASSTPCSSDYWSLARCLASKRSPHCAPCRHRRTAPSRSKVVRQREVNLFCATTISAIHAACPRSRCASKIKAVATHRRALSCTKLIDVASLTAAQASLNAPRCSASPSCRLCWPCSR